MTTLKRQAIAAALIGFFQASTALATEAKLGLGAGVVPDYEGSDNYQFIPFPSFEIEHEGFKLQSSQLGIEADIVPFEVIQAGPIIRYDMGRDGDVRDDFVARLPEVDGSVEVGGYIASGLPLSMLGMDSEAILFAKLSGVQGLDGGHEGAVFEGTLGIIAPVSDQLQIITAISTSYMSSDYAESYYSISAAGAAASGLAQYDADSGFKDIGVGVIATYNLTEQWSLTGIGAYKLLINDAAGSPVVKDRGSEDQFFGGFSIGYKF